MNLSYFLALILALCSGPACGAVGVIIIGQAVPSNAPHMFWLMNEPGFDDLCLIPTMSLGLAEMAGQAVSIEEARRRVRIYFPRSEERLGEYDFTMFAGAIVEPFTILQIANLHRAIEDGGMGGIVSVGGLTKDAINPNTGWMNSMLADAFPNDPAGSLTFEFEKDMGAIFKIILNRDQSLPPVLTPFLPYGIEKWPGNSAVWMLPREGTKTFAWMEGPYEGLGGLDRAPFLLLWEYGKGRTWSQADGFTHLWWSGYRFQTDNAYGHDILVNLILYSIGMELPQDIAVVHELRVSYEYYSTRRALIFSLLDFVEKMGGRIDLILRELTETDETLKHSKTLFAEQAYDESLATFELALDGLDAIEVLSMETKSRVLFWTYVIEYLAVTGTTLLSASLLYELMVKRRLFRRVGTSRHVRRGNLDRGT